MNGCNATRPQPPGDAVGLSGSQRDTPLNDLYTATADAIRAMRQALETEEMTDTRAALVIEAFEALDALKRDLDAEEV